MRTLEVMDKYLKAKRFRPETIISLKHFFNQINSFSEEFPSNAGQITECLKWLEESYKLSDTTLRLRYQHFKMVYKFLERYYDIPDPMKKVDPIKVQHKQRRYFTPEQIGLIINSCNSDFERALILTLIDSACRIGELVNLTVNDIGENEIHVSGKTGQRTYRLDHRICEALKRIAQPNGYIFKPATNYSLPARILTNKTRTIIKRAGIQGNKLGPHTLRHSSASLVAKETGSILAVKALLQHSDQKTTQLYIHDVENKLQQQVSPLKLVSDKIYNSNDNLQQATLISSGTQDNINTDIVPIENNNNHVDELLESSYQEVPDNIHIRPQLKTDDLKLIRRAFICLSQYGQIITDGTQSRELYRRMLRKI